LIQIIDIILGYLFSLHGLILQDVFYRFGAGIMGCIPNAQKYFEGVVGGRVGRAASLPLLEYAFA